VLPTLPDSSLVTSTLGFAIILILFIAAVFAVFALIVNVYIKRIIIRPIKALEIRVHQLAEGELDKQIHTIRQDEIGNLLNATERLRRSLKIAQAIAEPGLEWGEHVS
jgi:HAMP domain-containing protein